MIRKLFMALLICFSTIFAQGITNTLGGNSDSDKFIVENKVGNDIITATGEGQIFIGDISEDISGYRHKLYVQGDDSGIFVNSEGNLISGVMCRSIGPNVKGFYADVDGSGAQGLLVTARGEYARAISAHIQSSDAETCAGEFYNQSPDGYGIRSRAQKYPIYGNATASSGFHYGGFFEANGASGRGVYATSSTSTGSAYGGVFEARNSDDGVGVWADGKKYDFYAAGAGDDYAAASSKRWKNNIVEIDNPIEKLSQLRGVYFDWDEEHGGEHDLGCIAEEIGKVLPEIVTYEENGIDAEGMDYSKLTPLLIEAVKALEKRVTELESR